MPGFMPGIHALLCDKKGVDGRDKPGHDEHWFNARGRDCFASLAMTRIFRLIASLRGARSATKQSRPHGWRPWRAPPKQGADARDNALVQSFEMPDHVIDVHHIGVFV